MKPITDPELRRLAEHYATPSSVRTELEYLRLRVPMLETREQLEQNRRDRANLNRLLLVMT
jgi:hypothetical protein